MVGPTKIFPIVILVAFVIILLCLLLPIPILLELFLIVVGILLIIGSSLVIAREVTGLIDLSHRNRIRQELRKLDLKRIKQRSTLLDIRYRRAARGRNHHQ